jgi:hypothetical protein
VSQSPAEFPDSSLPDHINLREINLIAFPDWSRPEESLSADLVPILRTVLTHPDKSHITLLLDTSLIPEEEASLILSGILMNFLLQENLSIEEEAEITAIGTLNHKQWETLLQHIQFRIVLAAENQHAIAQSGAGHLPCYDAEEISLKRFARFNPFTIPVPFIDPKEVEILQDISFQQSLQEVAGLTLLDVCRLANLWQLCRLSNPKGNILEIGTYKGGAALHLSNSCPTRKIIICDSFQGFETVDPQLDYHFKLSMFKDVSKERVESLFQTRQRNYEVIDGFFPKSCADREIKPVSFIHLDVDTYKSTIESLHYIETASIAIEKSIIVLDDFCRNTEGVNKAVSEFTSAYKNWVSFPMFPGQGLLLHRSWFSV